MAAANSMNSMKSTMIEINITNFVTTITSFVIDGKKEDRIKYNTTQYTHDDDDDDDDDDNNT